MNKKFYVMLSLFVIAAMLLGACGGTKATEESTAEGTTEGTTEETTGDKLAVGIVLPTKDEPRWIQDQARFEDALVAAGYEVEILFSQGDSAKEKANVEA
ncbi:MAG: hypothetical protein K8R40_12695, partial [Anaerolineaceae bacterium]|nr:hypothetical protein [Anaerolineaceae bacterium]